MIISALTGTSILFAHPLQVFNNILLQKKAVKGIFCTFAPQ